MYDLMNEGQEPRRCCPQNTTPSHTGMCDELAWASNSSSSALSTVSFPAPAPLVSSSAFRTSRTHVDSIWSSFCDRINPDSTHFWGSCRPNSSSALRSVFAKRITALLCSRCVLFNSICLTTSCSCKHPRFLNSSANSTVYQISCFRTVYKINVWDLHPTLPRVDWHERCISLSRYSSQCKWNNLHDLRNPPESPITLLSPPWSQPWTSNSLGWGWVT